MKVDTTYPDEEQLDTFQSLVHAEHENASFWSPHLSSEIMPFIDYHSIKLPSVLTSHCKYAIAYMADNNEDRALLLLAALRVLGHLNDFKVTGTRVLFTAYNGNMPISRELDSLIDEDSRKILYSPVHWSA